MNEEIEKKILDYFKPVELKILDEGYNDRGYYNSVTVKYIHKWVLDEEYKMSDVVDVLLQIHKHKKLCSLYCGTVENVVFHNSVMDYWNYALNNGYEKYCPKYNYKYFLDYLKQLKLESQLELKT